MHSDVTYMTITTYIQLLNQILTSRHFEHGDGVRPLLNGLRRAGEGLALVMYCHGGGVGAGGDGLRGVGREREGRMWGDGDESAGRGSNKQALPQQLHLTRPTLTSSTQPSTSHISPNTPTPPPTPHQPPPQQPDPRCLPPTRTLRRPARPRPLRPPMRGRTRVHVRKRFWHRPLEVDPRLHER